MAFHFLTTTGVLSTDLGGILPDPVVVSGGAIELGTTIFPAKNPVPGEIWVMSDGKFIDVTASVSGSERYFVVQPGDYPIDELGRRARTSHFSK